MKTEEIVETSLRLWRSPINHDKVFSENQIQFVLGLIPTIKEATAKAIFEDIEKKCFLFLKPYSFKQLKIKWGILK